MYHFDFTLVFKFSFVVKRENSINIISVSRICETAVNKKQGFLSQCGLYNHIAL